MTRRKPVDESFESWTERLVREAQERGEHDDLPGAGRPIPDLDRPWSAERRVADLVRREGVDLVAALPVPLRLRREREQLLDGLVSLTGEARCAAGHRAGAGAPAPPARPLVVAGPAHGGLTGPAPQRAGRSSGPRASRTCWATAKALLPAGAPQ